MKPIFQFLIIGGLAYLIQQWIGPQELVSVTPNKISILQSQWEASTGLQANRKRLEAIVEAYTEEEILFQEAIKAKIHHQPSLRRRIITMAKFLELNSADDNDDSLYEKAIGAGLHKSDIATRNMMIQSVRNSILSSTEIGIINAERIHQYYLHNIDRYMDSENLSFDHVYFSKRKKDNNKKSAEALRENDSINFHTAKIQGLSSAGDPFLKGHSFTRITASDLTDLMGQEFSQKVFQLKPLEWSNPIASMYGSHLVRVNKIYPMRAQTFEEAEFQVKKDLKNSLSSHAYAQALSRLKQNYSIVVEWPTDHHNVSSIDESQG